MGKNKDNEIEPRYELVYVTKYCYEKTQNQCEKTKTNKTLEIFGEIKNFLLKTGIQRREYNLPIRLEIIPKSKVISTKIIREGIGNFTSKVIFENFKEKPFIRTIKFSKNLNFLNFKKYFMAFFRFTECDDIYIGIFKDVRLDNKKLSSEENTKKSISANKISTSVKI